MRKIFLLVISVVLILSSFSSLGAKISVNSSPDDPNIERYTFTINFPDISE